MIRKIKKKIFVVDDDKEFLYELELMLKSYNYVVKTASDGITALKIIPVTKPDLILLDLNMEKVSGFQVADKLRQSSKTKNIPILAITGYFTEKEHYIPMSICGIKKCLMKPFSPEHLIETVESILNPST